MPWLKVTTDTNDFGALINSWPKWEVAIKYYDMMSENVYICLP